MFHVWETKKKKEKLKPKKKCHVNMLDESWRFCLLVSYICCTYTHIHTHTHNLLTNSCMIETYDDLVTLIGRKLRQRVHDYIWLVEKSNNDDNLMVAFETWLISDKKIQLFFCHYKTFTAFRL
jgi:hypothetical protein